MRKALLVMHSPLDNTVGISNALQIFSESKHPKSFVSLGDADHLLTRKSDAIYVAKIIATWSDRYIF
jgi:putative redox protein